MRPTKTYKTIRLEKDTGIPENLKNCNVCGKVFIAVGDERICRDCFKNEEADRNRLMDYVRDNPGITINEAIEATGVPDRMVKRMVLEGTFSDQKDQAVTRASRVCVICGAPVGGSGIYCRRCAERFQRNTKQIADQTVDPNTNKKGKDLTTIDRLNAQAAKEVAREQRERRERSARPIYTKM